MPRVGATRAMAADGLGRRERVAEFDGADEIAAAVLDHYNRVARELAVAPEA